MERLCEAIRKKCNSYQKKVPRQAKIENILGLRVVLGNLWTKRRPHHLHQFLLMSGMNFEGVFKATCILTTPILRRAAAAIYFFSISQFSSLTCTGRREEWADKYLQEVKQTLANEETKTNKLTIKQIYDLLKYKITKRITNKKQTTKKEIT